MFDNITIKGVKLHVGELIKTLRSRAGLTQEQVAQELGLSRITIQNLESGKNPTIDTFLKVLQHFDLLKNFDSYIETEMQNNSQQSLY